MNEAELPCNQPSVVAVTGIEVRRSTVEGAGLGLFAVRAFAAGDVVCVYTGVILTAAEIGEMEGFGEHWPLRFQYVMDIGADGVCVDIPENGLPARFINDNRDRSKINIRYVKQERLLLVELVATCDIAPGEELFVDYGPQYWTGSHELR